MRSILFFLLIISLTYSQNPEPIVTDQNFIQPTVAAEIATQNQPQNPSLHDQAVQPQINNEPSTQNQNNQQTQQVIPSSQQNIQNLQGQAIPIQTQKNPENSQPQSQKAEQIKINQDQKARKMAEEARRQAERDKMTRDQQQDEQLRNIQSDPSLSKTERKKKQERLIFRKKSRSVDSGTRFTQYLFEQGLVPSQFFIKLPATQQVAINMYTYVTQDNTYVRTKNIEEESPVKVYIYENNQNIIYQGEFYYQNYIVFQGQAGATYLIKVVNNGRTKLISMNCKKMVEEAHLEETLQKHDGQHVVRTQNLAIEISRWHQQFRKITMLDFQDLKSVQGFIEKYYSWELVETFVAIVLCVLQVQLIQKMFKGNSIV